MKKLKQFTVKMDSKTYIFYSEIAKITKKPIEEVLSGTLYKYAEIVVREVSKAGKYEDVK